MLCYIRCVLFAYKGNCFYSFGIKIMDKSCLICAKNSIVGLVDTLVKVSGRNNMSVYLWRKST